MSQSNAVLQVVDAANNIQQLLVSQDTVSGAMTPYHFSLTQVNGANVGSTNPLPVSLPNNTVTLANNTVVLGNNTVSIANGAIAITVGANVVSGTNPMPVTVSGAVSVNGSYVSLLIAGANVANANPVPVSIIGGGLSVNGSAVIISTAGANVSPANPFPVATQGTGNVSVQYGGVNVGTANPFPVATQGTVNTAIQVAGANVAAGNPLPITVVNGAITVTNGAFSFVTTPNNGLSVWAASGAVGGNPQLNNSPVNVATGNRALRGFDFVNQSNVAGWIQIFDALANSVTLGTSIPKMVKYLPPGPGGVWEEKFTDDGIFFANAISIAVTSTPTGNGAMANTVLANVVYK